MHAGVVHVYANVHVTSYFFFNIIFLPFYYFSPGARVVKHDDTFFTSLSSVREIHGSVDWLSQNWEQ